MTSTLEHEIAAYLRSQARRVEVTDELDAIENDLLVLPRARVEQRHQRLAPVLGVAAAVLMIGGLRFLRNEVARPCRVKRSVPLPIPPST